MERLTPLLRAPVEVATGKTFFNNKPVPDMGSAIAQNINPFDWISSVRSQSGSR